MDEQHEEAWGDNIRKFVAEEVCKMKKINRENKGTIWIECLCWGNSKTAK